jgi:hypothetical protein
MAMQLVFAFFALPALAALSARRTGSVNSYRRATTKVNLMMCRARWLLLQSHCYRAGQRRPSGIDSRALGHEWGN